MWFINKAKEINDSGRYFPILSECHGFQAILIALAGNNPNLEKCHYKDGQITHPLNPTEDYKYSKLYSKMDQNLLNRVWASGDLAFSHGCGITLEDAYAEPEIKK